MLNFSDFQTWEHAIAAAIQDGAVAIRRIEGALMLYRHNETGCSEIRFVSDGDRIVSGVWVDSDLPSNAQLI